MTGIIRRTRRGDKRWRPKRSLSMGESRSAVASVESRSRQSLKVVASRSDTGGVCSNPTSIEDPTGGGGPIWCAGIVCEIPATCPSGGFGPHLSSPHLPPSSVNQRL